ncbi:MAG TPA: hypothetical protein VK932_23205 [Kofleriaceae bacterium]|nr:hypothetical protein [Kofleriaceae bacterium]
MYARKPFGAQAVTVAATTHPPKTLDVGALLAARTSTLLSAGGRTYALDSGDLYTLEDRGPALIRRRVRSIAGNEHLRLVCTMAGELEVQRDGATELRTRCARQTSTWPMATAGGDYAALLDSTTLLLVRGKQALHLPTRVEGEYELALSSSGLLAMADFSDRTWFVRPGGASLEPGPSHSARPTSVAAAGRFAAWGYTDGAVIAIDAATGTSWTFSGHGYAVQYLAIDERHARVISAGGDELRVWSLVPGPLARVGGTPCLSYNAEPSLDRTHALFDCDDGGVHLWSLASGRTREVHRHGDLAYGVAWLRAAMCSAGYDRRVICTGPDGASRVILSGAGAIRRLKTSPDHERFAISTEDGQIREFDGTLRPLFAHQAKPYQLAFSPDGRWLASGAADGSVIVWDVARREVRSRTRAHTGWVTSLAWREDELWTASVDETLKRWRNEPATLALADTRREQGEIWFLHLLADGWIASANRRALIIHRPPPVGALRLDLDRRIERVEVSPDGRYVAAAASGEVVVIDQVELAVASLPITTIGIGIVGFVDSTSLTISKSDGLFTVSLSALELARFAPRAPND